MMNMRLIAETVKLVNSYFEAENIMVSNQIIEAQAIDWYNHSEIVEAEMLAAAVMNYGNYRPGTIWNELEQLREFYFPSEPIQFGSCGFDENCYEMLAMENFSVEEIEAAQRDAMWQ